MPKPLAILYKRLTGKKLVGQELLGQDETREFTIQPVGEPLGRIAAVGIRDQVTGIEYDVIPGGVQAYCTPGVGNLMIMVAMANDGPVTGNIWVRITDDAGVELHYGVYSVAAGYWNFIPGGVIVDMPARSYGITIEVGH